MFAAPERRPREVLDRRYRLVHRLGRGGFGDVWRAEELLPDGTPFRNVALKLLSAGGADAQGWAEEAKLLASFRHPSLVTIYAAGILEGAPSQCFVAMELLEGQTLGELVRVRRRIPWRRVLAWAESAAAALDVIHAGGVVHLDLKPANLFLSTDGTLKVLDFGIARRAGGGAVVLRREGRVRVGVGLGAREAALASTASLALDDALGATTPLASSDEAMDATQQASFGTPAVVVGTPGFVAPEVLEMAEPSAAADAYALAVCVVQLITGHLPYRLPDEPASWDDPSAVSAWIDALRRATVRGELRDFEREAAVPRGLGQLLRRLLAVDPRDRGVVPGKLRVLFEEARLRPHGVPEPPYFGLDPYPLEAEGVLFGRDEDIARFGRELAFEPALVLEGPRGVGKSSLVSAALVPRLGQRAIDGKDDWILVRIAPGDDPDRALDEALSGIAPELSGASPAELAAHALGSAVGYAIVIDPLEEALAAEPSRRARLSDFIAALAERTSPGLRLIAALSEGHARDLAAAAPIGASLRAAMRFVSAPAATAARDLVTEPAHAAGITPHDVDAIVTEVQRELGAGSGRLSYVSLALHAFWQAQGRAPSEAASWATAWSELGGVVGALARHGDRALAALDFDDRAIAEEILLRLSSEVASRWPFRARELCETFGEGEARAERVLAALERAWLVRRQGEELRIGHEALATGWTYLANRRLQHFLRLMLLDRVREAAIAWEEAERARDRLLWGAALVELRRERRGFLARGLGARERAFVAASIAHARVVWAKRALGLVALMALAVSGFIGKRALDQARFAEVAAWRAGVEISRRAELAAQARREDDPYKRAAFIAAAMDRGSPDAMLPLDLASAAATASRARFLSLEELSGASFPWDRRWLVAERAGSILTLIDLDPQGPSLVDDLVVDADLEVQKARYFKLPRVTEIRPHQDAMVERAFFAFDRSLVTRSASGEVKVLRLADDGPRLAAVAPMRCTGTLRLAARAPVVACATEAGVSRWDLREKGAPAVATRAFAGDVADVSPDGAVVAAIEGARVLLWEPASGREAIYKAAAPVLAAKWSSRERALALGLAGRFEVIDFNAAARGEGAVVWHDRSEAQPTLLRWDEGGLDLAICSHDGSGRWHYLKAGGRAKGDAPPRGEPCAAPEDARRPTLVRSASDLGGLDVTTRDLLGGFRLGEHRVLSRDLVLFDGEARPRASRMLTFQGRIEGGELDRVSERDSVAAVARDEDAIAFEIGPEVRLYALPEGKRLLSRPGHLLGRCDDGRLLAWQAEKEAYRLIDVWTGAELGTVVREPGLMIGANSTCSALYTQRLDGTLVETTFSPNGPGVSRVLAVADGYVFDVRPSQARSGVGAGLLLSLSSGAIARLDEQRSTVELLGYATPRASALGDGALPGEVIYADATGVSVLRKGSAPDRLFEGGGEKPWEDVSVSPEGTSMLLVAADRIAAVDLIRRELLGSIKVEGKTRFARWDDEGSLLAWSFDRCGSPEGLIIPRGKTLAKEVARAMSNLDVEDGRLVIRP